MSQEPATSVIGGKRLILTITTGRSGTRYLAWVLRGFRNVEARHEPRPKFSDAFRTVAQFPEVASEFWRRVKLPRIARSSAPIYAETSHLAAKGFLESLIELGVRPDLIHLHRDPRAVAMSLWRLDTVPGRTYRGSKYYLAPSDRCFLPLEDAKGLHDYQLCYWYCLEIAERARVYAERYREQGVRVIEVALAELAEKEGIERLGRELELGPRRATARLGITRSARGARNRKREKKLPRTLSDGEFDRLEEEVRERVRRD